MMCPCFSGKPYHECCEPYHKGSLVPTPLALMRSRYSAYALKNADYILQTTHPDLLKKISSKEEILQFCHETSFDGLDILDSDSENVTFKAHLSRDGKDISFTEKSHFKKSDGRWKYHSGAFV